MRRALLVLLGSLLLAGPAGAANPDPNVLPRIGAVAPAFGLPAFRIKGEEEETRQVVELDELCGSQPLDGLELVLVAFESSTSASQDLGLVNGWLRKYGKDGLHAVVISTDEDSSKMREIVNKSKFAFPVLNDRFGVVARRYGISGAPFSLLLNAQCQVLGMSDKALSVDAERLGRSISNILSGASELVYDDE